MAEAAAPVMQLAWVNPGGGGFRLGSRLVAGGCSAGAATSCWLKGLSVVMLLVACNGGHKCDYNSWFGNDVFSEVVEGYRGARGRECWRC
jgi:hypothetical protein